MCGTEVLFYTRRTLSPTLDLRHSLQPTRGVTAFESRKGKGPRRAEVSTRPQGGMTNGTTLLPLVPTTGYNFYPYSIFRKSLQNSQTVKV